MAQQNLGNSLTSEYQKSEPFLWFHIALLAATPLTLIIAMLGLGVGDPVFPEWFEITVLGLPAIALPVILQWWKPLSPFSLWVFAKPLELSDESERRILAVVKDFKTVLVAIALGVLIDAIFYKIYAAAPLVAHVLPLPSGLRILGILWWLVFFLISNLLLQAGAVAIRILLLSEADLNKITPLPLEAISSAFTSIGKRSRQLLNFVPDAPSIIKVTLEPKPKVESQTPNLEQLTNIPIPEPETPPSIISPEAPPELIEVQNPIAPELPVSETVPTQEPITEIKIPEAIASPIISEIPEPVINDPPASELPISPTSLTEEPNQEAPSLEVIDSKTDESLISEEVSIQTEVVTTEEVTPKSIVQPLVASPEAVWSEPITSPNIEPIVESPNSETNA